MSPRHAAAVALAALLLAVAGPAAAIDLNEANRAQLEQLNGIGVDTAERILRERAKAPFRDWLDLQQRVKGLSVRRIEQLQAQGATINGVGGTFTARAPRAARETGK
jgi:competence protein ComEA